jgi:OPT oligopeptide transporter protein
MWTIALLFTTIGSGINMLLTLRRPSIIITSFVAQLLSFPVGKAWEKFMPAWEFKILGRTVSLNPGPFNIKEHTLITVVTRDTTLTSDCGKRQLRRRGSLRDRYSRHSESILRSRLWRSICGPFGPLYPVSRLRIRRNHATISGVSCSNDLAFDFDQRDAIPYPLP